MPFEMVDSSKFFVLVFITRDFSLPTIKLESFVCVIHAIFP